MSDEQRREMLAYLIRTLRSRVTRGRGNPGFDYRLEEPAKRIAELLFSIRVPVRFVQERDAIHGTLVRRIETASAPIGGAGTTRYASHLCLVADETGDHIEWRPAVDDDDYTDVRLEIAETLDDWLQWVEGPEFPTAADADRKRDNPPSRKESRTGRPKVGHAELLESQEWADRWTIAKTLGMTKVEFCKRWANELRQLTLDRHLKRLRENGWGNCDAAKALADEVLKRLSQPGQHIDIVLSQFPRVADAGVKASHLEKRLNRHGENSAR